MRLEFLWLVVVVSISVAPPQRESSVTVLEGVDATQTNMSFFRQQLQLFATHILRCTGTVSTLIFVRAAKNNLTLCERVTCLEHVPLSDESFGPRLLQMCNQALFECLALNLHCLRGDQRALTAVINHRIVSSSSLTSCSPVLSSSINP